MRCFICEEEEPDSEEYLQAVAMSPGETIGHQCDSCLKAEEEAGWETGGGAT